MSENCNDNLKKVFDLNTWNLIKVKSKYQFDCRDCGKDCQYVKCSKEFNEDILLCGTCKRRKHNLKKYGVPETRMLKSVQNKQKETWRNRTDLEKQQYHEKLSKIRRSFSEEKKKQIGSKISKSLLDKTSLEKQIIKEKRRHTCKSLYGDPDFRNQEKARQTKKDRYGDENYNNRLQARKTSLERFGVEVNTQGPLWKKQMRDIWRNRSKEEVERIYQKVKQTKKDRYGDENYNNREKSRETNLKKYGDPYYTNIPKGKETWKNKSITVKENWKQHLREVADKKTKEDWNRILKKRRETIKNKYGITHGFNFNCFYRYNNITFDSSWELAVWIWAKDHNKKIIREPIVIDYEFQKRVYHYFPDFEIDNRLIEIKGDHFFDNNGNLISPYGDIPQGLLQAKQLCMQKHNVQIYRKKDIDKILKEHIYPNYGRNYLKGFKIVKTSKR